MDHASVSAVKSAVLADRRPGEGRQPPRSSFANQGSDGGAACGRGSFRGWHGSPIAAGDGPRRPNAAEFSRTAGRTAGFDSGIQYALERLLVDRTSSCACIGTDKVAAGALSIASVTSNRLALVIHRERHPDGVKQAAERGHSPVSRPGTGAANAGLIPRLARSSQFRGPVVESAPSQGISRSDRCPDFDDNLLQAFKKKPSCSWPAPREDRSVKDLLNANYTFVNERWRGTTGFGNYGSRCRGVPSRMPSSARRSAWRGALLATTSCPDPDVAGVTGQNGS